MNETTMALLGFLVVAVTHILTQKGLTQKQATLIITTVGAVGYFVYTQFVPEATKEEIIAVITSLIGTGKIIYDFITTLQGEKKKNNGEQAGTELEQDAGWDEPDERDWSYRAIAGSEGESELPNSYMLSYNEQVQDQSLPNTPSTKMACGSYAMTHCINQSIEKLMHELKGNALWAEFVDYFKWSYADKGVDPVKDGSWLQDQIWFARERNHIAGWIQVTTTKHLKENIYRGRPIITGSKYINWKKTRESADKVAVVENTVQSGHFFAIVGWDGDKLICMNSYGKDAYDKGFFYIDMDDWYSLYTMYAIIFDDDTIQKWKQMRDKIIATAMAKVTSGKKLKVSEIIALRNRGKGDLIPDSQKDED